MDDEFLTVAQVADLFQLNEQTIRNWIERGDFPAVRLGRRVRVRRADLDAFLSRSSAGASEPELEQQLIWDGLGSALSDAQTALNGDDRVALAQSLRGLAKAANRLARALERG